MDTADTAVRFSFPLCGDFSAFSGLFRGSFSFGFYRGEIGFLANFLFCVVAFGSFAKVSASRSVRAFANVPSLGWTKNMTKTYAGGDCRLVIISVLYLSCKVPVR
jgi:hypothetical protein